MFFEKFCFALPKIALLYHYIKIFSYFILDFLVVCKRDGMAVQCPSLNDEKN